MGHQMGESESGLCARVFELYIVDEIKREFFINILYFDIGLNFLSKTKLFIFLNCFNGRCNLQRTPP